MDMSALEDNTNGSEDDESQTKLVLVFALDGFLVGVFHAM